MIRMGSGDPLVLFHGVMGSETMWREVASELAAEFDVIAPTALGHRGGPERTSEPVSFSDCVDCAERQLDALGIDRAHLVGNSLGGWMALELSRRGRARSVLALSPAGMWGPGGPGARTRRLRRALRSARLTRTALPTLYRSSLVRAFAFRDVAANGRRLSAERALELTDDMLACAVAADLLATGEHLTTIEAASCPITIAWSQRDRIFPPVEYAQRARELVPAAHFLILKDVGHVPMLDDPQRVADLIRTSLRPSSALRLRKLSSPGATEQTQA